MAIADRWDVWVLVMESCASIVLRSFSGAGCLGRESRYRTSFPNPSCSVFFFRPSMSTMLPMLAFAAVTCIELCLKDIVYVLCNEESDPCSTGRTGISHVTITL